MTKQELRETLAADARSFGSQQGRRRFRYNIFSNPISDQKYIWKYIRALRMCEYYLKSGGVIPKFLKIYWLHKLRKLGYKTGFQIPPNVCGAGLTIYHYGPVIVNSKTRIGRNCTLYPGVLIGHKDVAGGCAVIGDNVFIGAGTKIIGEVTIGDNVTIGQNCVITKDIPSDSVVVASAPLRRLH